MKFVLLIVSLILATNAYAADTFQGGRIYDITSTPDGLLIRLEGDVVPTQCPNPNGWGWMVIPEDNKTMISVALTMFVQGKTNATIYTSGVVGGFCKVIQYDPHS